MKEYTGDFLSAHIWHMLDVCFPMLSTGYTMQAETLAKQVAAPLEHIAQDMVAVSLLSFDKTATIDECRQAIIRSTIIEINDIMTAFIKMKTGLETFARYVLRIRASHIRIKFVVSNYVVCALDRYVPVDLVAGVVISGSYTQIGVKPRRWWANPRECDAFLYLRSCFLLVWMALCGLIAPYLPHCRSTVFLIDVTNFMEICNKLRPNELLLLLSQLFGTISAVVVGLGGAQCYNLILVRSLIMSLTLLLTFLWMYPPGKRCRYRAGLQWWIRDSYL
jgi:hypothetical protein